MEYNSSGKTNVEVLWTIDDINSRYVSRSLLYSMRGFDCFNAFDSELKQDVHLWVIRFPLVNNVQECERYYERMGKIVQLTLSTPPIISYGIDSKGNAFLSTHALSMDMVIDRRLPLETLPQLFYDIACLLVPLHSHQIVLGDFSSSSFVFHGDTQLMLLGFLGTFDFSGRKTSMLPPADTFQYLAPEQRIGGVPDYSTDVYSLGVYAYRLLTGTGLPSAVLAGDYYLASKKGAVKKPSELSPYLPVGIDDIIERCLIGDGNERYADVLQLVEALGGVLRLVQDPFDFKHSKPTEELPYAVLSAAKSLEEAAFQGVNTEDEEENGWMTIDVLKKSPKYSIKGKNAISVLLLTAFLVGLFTALFALIFLINSYMDGQDLFRGV